MRHNIITLLLAVATLFVSCDSDPLAKAKFPKPQTIECEAGDKPSITLTMEHDWRLSSDALWCKIYNLAEQVQDIAGSAGTHTFTLAITDESQALTDSEAHLTLHIGERSSVVATIIRKAESAQLRIFDSEGNPTEVIKIGSKEYLQFNIEANFRFAATRLPEWVDIEGGAISGGANKRITASARIVANGSRERYPVEVEDGHTITFSNEEGSKSIAVPIIFDGMSDREITILNEAGTTFGWEISLDGTEKRIVDDFTGEATPYDGDIRYSIAAREDKFEVVSFEMQVVRGIPTYTENPEWIKFDRATMTLSVEPSTTTRYGLVMAFPTGIYEEIKGDIKASLFELDYTSGIGIETLRYEYMPYTMLDFTQRDFSEVGAYEGMYIYHSLTAYEIPAEVYTDETKMAEYGVTVAYTCPFVNAVEGKRPGIIIDPRIEEWTSATQESGRATAELHYKGRLLKISENEYYMGENKDEVMAIHLWGPNDNFDEEVYILFKLDGKAEKLLVVTPPTK